MDAKLPDPADRGVLADRDKLAVDRLLLDMLVETVVTVSSVRLRGDLCPPSDTAKDVLDVVTMAGKVSSRDILLVEEGLLVKRGLLPDFGVVSIGNFPPPKERSVIKLCLLARRGLLVVEVGVTGCVTVGTYSPRERSLMEL